MVGEGGKGTTRIQAAGWVQGRACVVCKPKEPAGKVGIGYGVVKGVGCMCGGVVKKCGNLGRRCVWGKGYGVL